MHDAVNIRREAGESIFIVVGITHTDVVAERQKIDATVPWKLKRLPCSE